MIKLRIWFYTLRPKYWIHLILPIIVVSKYASMEEVWMPYVTVLSCIVGLLFLIVTNLVNDYYDFIYGVDQNDLRPAQRAMVSGGISARSMRIAIGCFITCLLALGVPLAFHAGWKMLFIGVAALVLAIGYSARPLSLASRGLGDLFTFVMLGPALSISVYYFQVHLWSWDVFYLGIIFGLLSAFGFGIDSLRDRDTDVLSEKRTLAVSLGVKWMRRLMLTELALALVFSIALFEFHSSIVIILILCICLSITYVYRASSLSDYLDCQNIFLVFFGMIGLSFIVFCS